MGESLEKELKNGCCWQNEAAVIFQKNRLSIGSLFFYLKFCFLAFTAVSVKSENTASIPNL
jgi:hypothetical protein